MILSRIPWKLVKGLSATVTSVTVGGSLYFLHRNDYDLSSIGAMRLMRAFCAATKIVADYKWSLRGLDAESEEYHQKKSLVHKRSAEILLKLACANGGVWIKVGQHCGALDYLLPQEYTSTLSVLHSQAPESSMTDIARVVKEDLHRELSELFDEFDYRPRGAASLAQVHKARLKSTGQLVAVKVQHPKVKPHSFVDMATMEVLVHIVSKLFSEFQLLWLAEETKRNLPRELDFLNEGKNAERVRRMFSHLSFLKVPKIIWDYSTDRVLVMEYCDGCQVNDVNYLKEHKIDPHEICRNLGELYSEMIFTQGYVHCDPHPGNVLVNKRPNGSIEISLLDHGLYQTLQDDFRLQYANLWLALLKPDPDKIQYWASAMGVGDLYGLFACMVTARSWKSVTGGIQSKAITKSETDEIRFYVSNLLRQITDILNRLPRPMLLILKTNDLLRGLEYKLGTQNRADSFVQMARHCIRAVHRQTLADARSWWHTVAIYVQMYFALARVYVYERWLMWSDFSAGFCNCWYSQKQICI